MIPRVPRRQRLAYVETHSPRDICIEYLRLVTPQTTPPTRIFPEDNMVPPFPRL